MTKILITGSRSYTDVITVWEAIEAVISRNPDTQHTIITGGCPTGADKFAKEVAQRLDLDYIEYPADWVTNGKKAGPIRNQQMIRKEQPDICLAFLDGESRGTRNTINLATKAGIPVITFDD